jgi:hypothetical protein
MASHVADKAPGSRAMLSSSRLARCVFCGEGDALRLNAGESR